DFSDNVGREHERNLLRRWGIECSGTIRRLSSAVKVPLDAITDRLRESEDADYCAAVIERLKAVIAEFEPPAKTAHKTATRPKPPNSPASPRRAGRARGAEPSRAARQGLGPGPGPPSPLWPSKSPSGSPPPGARFPPAPFFLGPTPPVRRPPMRFPPGPAHALPKPSFWAGIPQRSADIIGTTYTPPSSNPEPERFSSSPRTFNAALGIILGSPTQVTTTGHVSKCAEAVPTWKERNKKIDAPLNARFRQT